MGYNAAALEVVATIHEVVSKEPHLVMTETTNGRNISGSAMAERSRRNIEDELYRELSRYYPRVVGAWTHSKLLSKG
jgi:hypothetical protein